MYEYKKFKDKVKDKMDPSLDCLMITSSFRKNVALQMPKPYIIENEKIELVCSKSVGNIKTCTFDINKNLYNNVASLEYLQHEKGFKLASYLTNPFSEIGKSLFKYPDSVKLANLDAILDITKHQTGYYTYQTMFAEDEDYSYLDINGAPGGFSEYLQWRRPGLHGIGISPDIHIPWTEEILDTIMRFHIHKGNDNTGEIKTNIEPISKYTLEVHARGLDIVMASLFPASENFIQGLTDDDTFHELTAILITAVNTMRQDGTFILRFYDSYSNLARDFIYLMASIFESIWIMKPISTDLWTQEKFLVGKKLRVENLEEIIKFLLSMKKNYEKGTQTVSLFSKSPPQKFREWLQGINNQITSIQNEQLQTIKESMDKKCAGGKTLINEYNNYRALAIWNLPDNNIGF